LLVQLSCSCIGYSVEILDMKNMGRWGPFMTIFAWEWNTYRITDSVFFTNTVSAFQLFGWVSQYLSGSMPTIRHH